MHRMSNLELWTAKRQHLWTNLRYYSQLSEFLWLWKFSDIARLLENQLLEQNSLSYLERTWLPSLKLNNVCFSQSKIFGPVNVEFTFPPNPTKVFIIATEANGISFLTGEFPETWVASELKEGIGRSWPATNSSALCKPIHRKALCVEPGTRAIFITVSSSKCIYKLGRRRPQMWLSAG